MKKLDVNISITAQNQYLKILDYLSLEWPEKVSHEFKNKVDKKINQVAHFPTSCKTSKKKKGIYQAVVEKHTSFYYRIHKGVIEILIFVDNRMHPSRKDVLLKKLGK